MVAAGEKAKQLFLSVEARKKEDRTYVTEVDLAVQDQVICGLERLAPKDGVIAEELNFRKSPKSGHRIWTIDPIDGTAPFVAGIPTWSIGLGLLDDGRPASGFVYVPMTHEFFCTNEEGGVYRDGVMRNLRASDCLDSDTILFRHTREHPSLDISSEYPGKSFALGSACHQMSLVATGAADAVLLRADRIWDLVPGWAMLESNGGVLRYLGGANVCAEELMDGRQAPLPILGGHGATLDRIEKHILYNGKLSAE